MNRLSQILNLSDWPVPLQTYDRRPLSRQESDCISLLLQCRTQQKYWFKQAQVDLERLTTPVVDVLQLLDTKPKYRNEVLATLLLHQQTFNSVLWDWTDAQWQVVMQDVVKRKQNGVVASVAGLFLKVAYLLTGHIGFEDHEHFDTHHLAQLVFGKQALAYSEKRVVQQLVGVGFRETWCERWIPRVLAVLYLKHFTTNLEVISRNDIQALHDARTGKRWQQVCVRMTFAFAQLGILSTGLDPVLEPNTTPKVREKARKGIASGWLEWVDRWVATSTFSPANRKTHYRCLLLAGRWLANEHPGITTPQDWTRDLAVAFVAAVDRLKVGDWAYFHYKQKHGQPISAYTKSRYLSVLRSFFTDLQEWGWVERRFDPRRCLSVPRTIQGLLTREAKPIDASIWKKLVIGALGLNEHDLSIEQRQRYPLQMVKALAVVWVFSGLRPDEIRRLPQGCIRHSEDNGGKITWLDVPANKRNPTYTKPVDPVVGTIVQAWEQIRPELPKRIDPKSGAQVAYLFDDGEHYLSKHYLARALIPLLCRVAGVPENDSYGPITPNRARHTIAYQLANGRDPMPLLELQAWLGHRTPDSTMHYTVRTHLELSRAVEQHTTQQTRLVSVLVDRDAVASGAVKRGEPWKYYDVGHGYCTHDFFETCPHRIACARCSSYQPKASSRPQLEEATHNLLKMREAIPLTDEMRKAIDEGLEAVNKLLERLADTPSLDGETPRQLGTCHGRTLNLIALADIPVK